MTIGMVHKWLFRESDDFIPELQLKHRDLGF